MHTARDVSDNLKTGMKSRFSVACVMLLAFVAAPARAQTTRAIAATAPHGMVAAGHPIATDAAVEVMRQGGNAIDAAVAAALMLGVVDGHNSGVGGGCFMLIRTADGTVVALDGRETAPAAAMREMFVRDGKADTKRSQTGALSVGVPGSLLVFDHATRQYGKKRLADLLEPAAKVAADGFQINASYAKKLREVRDDLARFPASRAILIKADGEPYAEGEVLRQPDLATSYRAVAGRARHDEPPRPRR